MIDFQSQPLNLYRTPNATRAFGVDLRGEPNLSLLYIRALLTYNPKPAGGVSNRDTLLLFLKVTWKKKKSFSILNMKGPPNNFRPGSLFTIYEL